MNYKELIKQFKSGDIKPVYFLHGDEPFYMDKITKYIEENVLSESERAFNQMIFYGKESDHKTIIDAASRYPMMAPRQVLILKEAQEMRTLKELLPYVKTPVATTLLVIVYKHKKLDKRTSFGKGITKHAEVFESKKLYDNKVAAWVNNYVKEHKATIDPQASQLIADYLGTNLSKVSNELDKLLLNVDKSKTITSAEVEKYIGISKDYNVFELQKALGGREILKANRIINYFIANPKKNPLVVVISTLYNFYSKVYQAHFLKGISDDALALNLKIGSVYFVKDYKLAARNYPLPKTEEILHLLSEYDLRSKGLNNNSVGPGELLKELVFKILH